MKLPINDFADSFDKKKAFLMQIGDAEFNQIRDLVYRHFGINLTEQKRSLVVGRLQKMVKESGYASFAQYYEHVLKNPSHSALNDLVNRISTNYTFFNREKEHFDFYHQTALPQIVAARKNERVLRVWCAASSTGEEPYMLGMLQMEYLKPYYNTWDAGVLATDISANALNHGRQGIYRGDEIRALPPKLVKTYFTDLGGDRYEVIPSLKTEVLFRRFNLMNKVFPFRRPFDIIFCRNVMIYFDEPTKEALIQRMRNHLAMGGYLFLGHSETILNKGSFFRYVRPSVYQKVG